MQTFWTVIFIAGLTSFYLLVLILIPLGARDLYRLLKTLRSRTPD